MGSDESRSPKAPQFGLVGLVFLFASAFGLDAWLKHRHHERIVERARELVRHCHYSGDVLERMSSLLTAAKGSSDPTEDLEICEEMLRQLGVTDDSSPVPDSFQARWDAVKRSPSVGWHGDTEERLEDLQKEEFRREREAEAEQAARAKQ